MTDTSEFIQNPTKLSYELVKIVLSIDKKHKTLLKPRSIFNKFLNDFKIEFYTKQGYKDYLVDIKNYKLKVPETFSSLEKLNFLLNEFKKLYSKLMYNNLVLAYYYTRHITEKNVLVSKEDEKILALKKFYLEEITRKEFNVEFGHYAINPYELSGKRFNEYTDSELKILGELAKEFSMDNKLIYNPNKSYNKNKLSLLIYLREYSKYQVLFIVEQIRLQVLYLEKKLRVKSIFGCSYEQIKKLYNSKKY